MYVIGITPGVFQIARAAGAEIAREFAGIEEKLRYGYTVGCNFFQIDQEVFGEFVEPNLIKRISRLIQEMNIQWALHGLLIGEVYQTLEPINYILWKLSHLILNRDLIFLYEILQEIKRNNYSKEVFPHYTIYHASKELVVGYAYFREKEILSEVLTTTPEGNTDWDSFLEKRRKLKEWFLENLFEILFKREVSRRFAGFIPSPLSLALINSLYIPFKDNKISEEDLRKILEKIKEDISEINIDNIVSSFNNLKEIGIKLIDENIIRIEEKVGSPSLINFLRDIYPKIKKLFEKVEIFFKEKNLENEFKKAKLESLENSYLIYKQQYERGIAKGAILYEDIAMVLVCKDVEFGYFEPNYKSFLSKKTCEFLIKRLLDGKKIEEHVREAYKKLDIKFEKELIDFERREINLTPELNVLASIVYSISHFLVGIENFPEILDETKRRNIHLNEEERKRIEEFAKKSPYEKLKIIIEELRKIGVDREEAFFIAIENPEASPPYEGLRRICRLKDVFITSEALNLEFQVRYNTNEKAFAACIDTEHLLSNAFNINNEIEELIKYIEKWKNEIYSRVAIYHIGIPKPYFGTTHIPFDIGSDEQYLIYEYSFKLKKAGFNDEKKNNLKRYSYLIFERGGGQLPFQFLRTVILALRIIKKYLEMNIEPNEIEKKKEYYSEFFGFDEQFIREKEIIFRHALEPLKGLIVWPEETHTILGREAIERFRKRPEEWAGEEYK
ncbi:MAG: hypothetical protein QXX04_00175 [Candidatus Aenigmatarchaeota archaeon]